MTGDHIIAWWHSHRCRPCTRTIPCTDPKGHQQWILHKKGMQHLKWKKLQDNEDVKL